MLIANALGGVVGRYRQPNGEWRRAELAPVGSRPTTRLHESSRGRTRGNEVGELFFTPQGESGEIFVAKLQGPITALGDDETFIYAAARGGELRGYYQYSHPKSGARSWGNYQIWSSPGREYVVSVVARTRADILFLSSSGQLYGADLDEGRWVKGHFNEGGRPVTHIASYLDGGALLCNDAQEITLWDPLPDSRRCPPVVLSFGAGIVTHLSASSGGAVLVGYRHGDAYLLTRGQNDRWESAVLHGRDSAVTAIRVLDDNQVVVLHEDGTVARWRPAGAELPPG